MPIGMPIGISCPACGSGLGYNGRCTQCGAQAFEPPPRWERVLMVIAAAVVIAVNCAAVPFYLPFVLALVLRILWLSRKGGDRA